MGWLMELVKGAVQGIFGVKQAEVLDSHLEFTRQQLEAERQAHAQAQQDLREARQRIAELEGQTRQAFLPFRGALFHRLPSGRLDRSIHCPVCQSSTTPTAGSRIVGGKRVPAPGRYCCPKTGCGWTSPFSTADGGLIHEAAAREYGIELA